MQGRARLLLSLCCGCCLLLLAAHLRLDSAVRSYSYMNVVQQSFHFPPEDEESAEPVSGQVEGEGLLRGNRSQCRMRKRIIFAKTHKTGSTTLQNIFHRFGEQQDLMFVLPRTGVHYFSLKSPFTRNQADLYRAFSNVSFQVYAAHGRWDATEVKSLVPGAFAVTILRSPVEAFESYYSYMNIDTKLSMDINEFAMALAVRKEGKMEVDVKRGRNNQLWDLGLEVDKMLEERDVRAKVQSLEEEFDQVLILEHLDQSLVMMAESLCWSLRQVRYVTRNSRLGDYVTQLTAESRATLAAWLWADQLLYNHFLGRHEARLRQFGQERMAGAVATLRSLNEDLRRQCVTEEPSGEGGSSGPRQVEKMFHPGNKKIRPLVPTKHRAWCVPFLKTEIAFTKSLRSMNRAHVRKHFRLKQRRLECAGPGEGRTCVWRHATNYSNTTLQETARRSGGQQ